MDTRRKILVGLTLLLSITLVLFVVTLLVVWGVVPREVAVILFVAGLALAGATTWLGAWNNILSLVEKLFSNKTPPEPKPSREKSTPKEENPMSTVMPTTSESSTTTYTCYISHSHVDETLAAKLYADLKAHGIKVWRFAEDAKMGEVVWTEISEHIQANDKLIVICSIHSLASGPVSREIERALNREDVEHKNVLFPIRIDDYIFARDATGKELWKHPRRADVLSKIIGDFLNWDTDPVKYHNAFEKLLAGLQA